MPRPGYKQPPPNGCGSPVFGFQVVSQSFLGGVFPCLTQAKLVYTAAQTDFCIELFFAMLAFKYKRCMYTLYNIHTMDLSQAGCPYVG